MTLLDWKSALLADKAQEEGTKAVAEHTNLIVAQRKLFLLGCRAGGENHGRLDQVFTKIAAPKTDAREKSLTDCKPVRLFYMLFLHPAGPAAGGLGYPGADLVKRHAESVQYITRQ